LPSLSSLGLPTAALASLSLRSLASTAPTRDAAAPRRHRRAGVSFFRRGSLRVLQREWYGRVWEQQQQESCKSCTAHFLLWHVRKRDCSAKRASELRTCRPTTTTSCGAVPCQNRASTAQKADLLSRCPPPSVTLAPLAPPTYGEPCDVTSLSLSPYEARQESRAGGLGPVAHRHPARDASRSTRPPGSDR